MTRYEVAERLAAAGPALRVLDQAWCPTCDKRLAAVVIHDGRVWLWRMGGRAGPHSAMLAEFEWLHAETIEAGGDSAETARLLDEVRENRYPATAPSFATPVDATFRFDGYSEVVACRGCRSDVDLAAARLRR